MKKTFLSGLEILVSKRKLRRGMEQIRLLRPFNAMVSRRGLSSCKLTLRARLGSRRSGWASSMRQDPAPVSVVDLGCHPSLRLP